MKILFKIAVGLCIFLTSASLLSFLPPWTINRIEFIHFLSPYPLMVGHITGDVFANLSGILIITTGLIGFVIFCLTRYKKLLGLQILLFLTILYCWLNLFLLFVNPIYFNVLELVINIIFGLLCIIAILIFWKRKQHITRK